MENIGILLLAAGESSRLGHPKQLLKFKGRNLLENVILKVQSVFPSGLFTVLGYQPDTMIPFLHDSDYGINPDWESGMGNSMKYGLGKLLERDPQLDGVLILVCDQPFLNKEHLNKMLQEFDENSDQIITSVYKDQIGVPALFPRKFFQDMLKIDDKKGAKSIIFQNPNDLIKVCLDRGEIDIDTEEDLVYLSDENG